MLYDYYAGTAADVLDRYLCVQIYVYTYILSAVILFV